VSVRVPDLVVFSEEGVTALEGASRSLVLLDMPPPLLVVEVVSTNWRDDYFTKLGQYEAIGIPEYWIVDYAGLGGVRFIGKPKQPTITVYQLIEGEYEPEQFRGDDPIKSSILQNLNLTANQIFAAGR
ncbi:MAG: Uma2 family endonuclease, partial [Microcoleus sp. SIO2G3]|nr:Uma2 family endonuclease [Microcoleus sp. SIO2G3]